MNNRYSALAMTAGFALTASATPTLAQNAVETIDNAAANVGNAASNVGDDIAAGATAVGNAADNAVDVDVATTTDPSLTTTGDLNATDANMMAMEPANDVDMMTTTTTERESSGKGGWGLLGLAGLLSFLFKPKKPAIHLDERHNARV